MTSLLSVERLRVIVRIDGEDVSRADRNGGPDPVVRAGAGEPLRGDGRIYDRDDCVLPELRPGLLRRRGAHLPRGRRSALGPDLAMTLSGNHR